MPLCRRLARRRVAVVLAGVLVADGKTADAGGEERKGVVFILAVEVVGWPGGSGAVVS